MTMRRGWTLSVLLILWSAAQAAGAEEKMRFALSWVPTGRDAGFYAALDRGHYKEEGLAVEILKGSGSGDTIRRVAVGTEEFGFADTATLVISRSRGTLVKVVAMIHDKSMYAVYSLKASGITKPKDLEGKKIGSPAKSAVRTVFPAFATLNGVDVAKIEWVDMGNELMPAALASRRVDAVLMFANEVPVVRLAAQQVNQEVAGLLFSDYGVDVYSNGLIAADKTIRERPELVRRFVRGTMKGVAWAAENIDGAAEVFVKHNPTASRDVAREYWKVAVDHLVTPTARKMGLGYMTREKVEATRDLITTYEKLPVKIAVEDLYTNDFLPKILPK